MKLLKKSVIQVDLAQQRKQQIDEGILIARRVDALRKTLGELEIQHATFIAGMKEELRKQTEPLFKKISELKSEIEALEVNRKKLLEPLDNAWTDVRAKEIEAAAQKRQIELGLAKIDKEISKLTDRDTQSKQSLARIKVRERELLKMYDDANIDRQNASQILIDAGIKKTEIDDYFIQKNREFLEREKTIIIKEKEIRDGKEQLKAIITNIK